MARRFPGRLLDLFCGAGGAAAGYDRAGFEVTGVDIVAQPSYPFRFIQADALAVLDAMIDGREDIGYALIHASPPCQRFSRATADPAQHPDLIAAVRERLDIIGLPYVIENVPDAPVRPDVKLCGSMFDLQIQRHRHFELSDDLFVWSPPLCDHEWSNGRPITVTGNADGPRSSTTRRHSQKHRDLDHARQLLDMPWCVSLAEVTEAIPPAYTEYLANAVLKGGQPYG